MSFVVFSQAKHRSQGRGQAGRNGIRARRVTDGPIAVFTSSPLQPFANTGAFASAA